VSEPIDLLGIEKRAKGAVETAEQAFLFNLRARADVLALLDLVFAQTKALLVVEFTPWENGESHCPVCKSSSNYWVREWDAADKVLRPVPAHAPRCLIDCSLAAAGLLTQASRDKMRALLEIR
jgi:hypothetical protein